MADLAGAARVEIGGAIMVLEDDVSALREILEAVRDDGYQAYGVTTIQEMWSVAAQQEINLFLLDLRVPDGDGLAAAREIRSQSDVGIIIITGRAHESDRIIGLEFGADDYITKPFSPRELLARIKAVLRRTKTTRFGANEYADGPLLRFTDWLFDPGARRLVAPGGNEISLTTAEFELLAALVGSPRRALTRDQLLTAVHGENWYGYDRGIDGLVSRLRRKFAAEDPQAREFIKSVRGYGYMFTERVQT